MQFVALDLETTGLDPNTDTIIEIAAIRFHIELEGDIFVMKDLEERSMLIHPGRPLEQEVSMITGITNEMLAGKPDFESVRDKVRDFIGDAIIVGHNVLFDIAMFTTHGFDLENHTVIDTFELSELFSQDIESLNLGFLANRYSLIDPNEAEHRALTDTKLSIRLLMRYLGEIRRLEGKKLTIWNTLKERDPSMTLTTLSKICRLPSDKALPIEDIYSDLIRIKKETPIETNSTPKKQTQIRSLHEISGNPHEELLLIKNIFKTHTHIRILTPGYRPTIWMSQLLRSHNIESMVAISPDKWCSVSYIQAVLSDNTLFSRKELILILKLAFWITETKTGLIDELKFYGEERAQVDIYRAQESEYSLWRERYDEAIEDIPAIISDISSWKDTGDSRLKVIKDIPLLEDIIRRKESEEISFDRLSAFAEGLKGEGESIELRIHITDMISIIRGIYESIPDRPTGPLISPPGNYGETYFITQKMLWDRGHKWLIHASKTLDASWKKWKKLPKGVSSREEALHIAYTDRAITSLIQYHTFKNENLNISLNINEGKTKISLIPRSVVSLLQPILEGSLAFGSHILLPQTKSFLIKEYGYEESEFDTALGELKSRISMAYLEWHPNNIQPGAVILTTSQKSARDIGQTLRKTYGKNREILIQGLSGGKGKMLSIFKNKIEQTILIGIIDTWRDDFDLWQVARSITIVKLPFDPPTDPYFLARTVGMSNNFSEYSEPIVIIRLNTLIERILEGGYTGNITIADPRLCNTEWGKRILGELL